MSDEEVPSTFLDDLVDDPDAEVSVKFTFRELIVEAPIDNVGHLDLRAFNDACWGVARVLYHGIDEEETNG